jgi:Phosphotransferase enzyme family
MPVSKYPEVDRVIHELGLKVWQLLENGPRYAVASTEYKEQPALFKMMVPHAENPVPPEDKGVFHPILLDDVRKEIALLGFLSEQQERIAGKTPLLLDHGELPGSAWYIRELMHGSAMATPDQPFVFPEVFYLEVAPVKVVAYFRSLHELSPTPELSRNFKLWYPRQEHIELLIKSLDSQWSHPEVRKLSGRLGPWLREREPELRRETDRVIAHNEPYASHLFVEDGAIGFIDWESASWGHRLHDFSRLWVRFFDHDEYRAEFEAELREAGYFDGKGALDWDANRLIQSTASLNYYYNNHVLEPAKEQGLYRILLDLIQDIAKRRY